MSHESEIRSEVIENMLADFDEMARLRTLSNEELVMECVSFDLTECPIVDELCTRLFPDWDKEGH